MQEPCTRRAAGRSRHLVLVFASICFLTLASGAQTIPPDAAPTCTVTDTAFASWFASGQPQKDGLVQPANSIAFPHNNNCDFYRWSKQMFLWLTSPVSPGGPRVMDSSIFFDVSPANPNGQRTLIPHTPGMKRNFAVRAAQMGPHGLPVIVDKLGRVLEVAPSDINQPLIVHGVLVASAKLLPGGTLLLSDKAEKPIPSAPRLSRAAANVNTKTFQVQQHLINGVSVFVDPQGNVIDVEYGQAGKDFQGVLLSQDISRTQQGSLVYYVTMVNDVYAYFLGSNVHNKPKLNFPTTQSDIDRVTSFAKTQGVTLPDANALAVEVKTSWVEAASLPSTDGYITMMATVPVFRKSPDRWKPSGQQKDVLLAMVGAHVVGSANGHPEMIWSTFEHFNNAPNEGYSYIDTLGHIRSVPRNTTGTWLFANTTSQEAPNALHAFLSAPDIVAPGNDIVRASSLLRVMPFGSSDNESPNPEDKSPAAANTQILSIHNSVAAKMPRDDVRNGYYFVGSTWTLNGAAPTTSFGDKTNPTGNEIGTSMLSNVTMESFQQASNSNFQPNHANCMFCHSLHFTPNHGQSLVGVSHIYTSIQPLESAR